MARFQDEFTSTGGLDFIKKAERHAMIDEGRPFHITKVIDAPSRGTYGPKYVAVVELDGELRGLSFGKASGVESRDEMFEALLAFFEREDAEPYGPVKMVRAGQATLIVDVEEGE